MTTDFQLQKQYLARGRLRVIPAIGAFGSGITETIDILRRVGPLYISHCSVHVRNAGCYVIFRISHGRSGGRCWSGRGRRGGEHARGEATRGPLASSRGLPQQQIPQPTTQRSRKPHR